MADRRRDPAAIVGLGLTEMGKVFGRSAGEFAGEAVHRALTDAGMEAGELDGLLVSGGISGGVEIGLSRQLGLKDLSLLSEVNAFGATASSMVTYASLAIEAGVATAVACVWADAPMTEDRGAGASYSGFAASGLGALAERAGLGTAPASYALAARRHMHRYGTTSEQLGSVAVQTREWATKNPLAQMRTPISLDDHQESRVIADPLHLLDCCLVSNGGVAVIVSSAERAAGHRQPPIYVLGFGQGHPDYEMGRGSDFGLVTGAKRSGEMAMRMAGVGVADVDVSEIYDCFTFTTLVTLEDYGFCEKGEGGPFVQSGALGPGGAMPTNTGGGQLSSFYMWSMTPLSEAIIQARGQGGERQVDKHDIVLVSGNGGILDYHGTLVLSPHNHV
jgi:acetyl-CoA acetyltransferase